MIDNEKIHAIPCTQVDNIEYMKKSIDTINENIDKLYSTIDGNGKPGMKTDLAILKNTISEIKEKVSINSEVRIEGEVQRRVGIEVDKYKNSFTEKQEKKTLKAWQIIGIIIGSIVGLTTVTLGIVNVAERSKERNQKIEKIDAWMNLWDFSPITRGGKPVLDTTKFNIKKK